MDKTKFVRTMFFGTFLSILVFFSISFITILTQINPLHYYKDNETYKLDIGFPFKYYGQFFAGDTIPNSGWTPNNLFYDWLLTLIIVTGLYYLRQRRKNYSL